MQLTRITVVAIASTALLAPVMATSAQANPVPITSTGAVRIAGADRYATAVKVSQKSFSTPQANLVIASGESWADALAAGPFAASLNAPILLVRKNSVPAVVAAEYKRLRATKVYIVGGQGAITDATWTQLTEPTTWPSSSERVSGADRYATAYAVYQRMTGVQSVYVASGVSFADALAGGAAAAAEGGALLLTPPTSLAPQTAKAVSGRSVVILGGTSAVSASVEQQIKAKAATGQVDRAAGHDRYETAAIVADALWGATGADAVFYASGTNFPDALAAAPAAYVNDAPVLLTRGSCTPEPTAVEEESLAPSLGVFLGGPTVTYSGAKVC